MELDNELDRLPMGDNNGDEDIPQAVEIDMTRYMDQFEIVRALRNWARDCPAVDCDNYFQACAIIPDNFNLREFE